MNERRDGRFHAYVAADDSCPDEKQVDHGLEISERMQSSLSLLALWCRRRMLLSLWRLSGYLVIAGWLCALNCQYSWGFGTVTLSTSTTKETEKSFIASTTNQFLVGYVTNPLVSDTWSMKLFGPNPNYDPAPTREEMLNAVVTVDSYTYVYGFADGQDYAHKVDDAIVGDFIDHCSTPMAGITTWDLPTCYAVTMAIHQDIFKQSSSTPTIVGGF